MGAVNIKTIIVVVLLVIIGIFILRPELFNSFLRILSNNGILFN